MSVTEQGGILRRHWLLALALAPLAVSLGRPADDAEARFDHTLRAAPPAVRARIERARSDPSATIDDLFDALPGDRIDDAFAPRRTTVHWGFAAVAAALAIVLLRRPLATLMIVAIFTATVGIALLLIVQPLIAQIAFRGENNFAGSVLSCVVAVGFTEQLTTLIPILWRVRRQPALSRQAVLLWGLASGFGFGIAEGVIYSQELYNGVARFDAYLVRFTSCVALHGVWTASAALCLHDLGGATVLAIAAVRAAYIPAVLHGLYDAALMHQHDFAALAAAIVSVTWLALQVELRLAAESPPSLRFSAQ